MNAHASETPPLRSVFIGWAFWFSAAVTALFVLTGIFLPDFVVNSWTHLELSNTIFTDFYRQNTVRNFDSHVPYSQALPLLWSTVLGVVRRVMDLGIYTGNALNFPVCLGLLAALIRLFQQIGLPGWVGAGCYLSLLGYAPFQAEAVGARTIPLALAFLAGALVVLASERYTAPRVALAGLLMGLAALTRFDAMAPACFIGCAFAARSYWMKRRFSRAATAGLIYFAMFAVTISPMMVYGMKHFGKPFPSDNTRCVLQARDGAVLDYYKTPPPNDLVQHPAKWVAGLLLHKIPIVIAVGLFVIHPENQSGILFLIAILMVAWGGGALRLPGRALRFTLFALALVPVMLLPAALGGFVDSRYNAAPLMIVFAALFVVLYFLFPSAWTPRRARLLLVAAALPVLPTIMQPWLTYHGHHFSRAEAMLPLSPTPLMRQLTEAVHRDSAGQPHELILTDGSIEAAEYGALTGEPVVMVPAIVTGTFADFARDWHITHIYTGVLERPFWETNQLSHIGFMTHVRAAGVQLIPLDMPGLFRVQIPASQTRP